VIRRGAKSFLDSQCELVFTRVGGKITVELHWDIVPRYFGATLWDAVWERSRQSPKDNLGFRALPAEEALVALSIHGNKPGWERPIWICDVAQTIRQHSLDWKRVMALSRALGSQRIISLALVLAHDVVGARIPAEFQQTKKRVEKLKNEVIQRLSQRRSLPLTFIAACCFHVKTRERLRDRLRYCLRLRRLGKRTIEEVGFFRFGKYLNIKIYFKHETIMR